jgi:hypothetical protein
VSTTPVERLKAIGRGYVRVAIEHPAHCEVMFRDDVISPDDARLADAGLAAYGVLEATVAAIAARHDPTLPVREAARLCWSAMQGLVALQSKFEYLDHVRGGHPRRPRRSIHRSDGQRHAASRRCN